MKLTDELKKRIDKYFEEISSEELYRVSTVKYGFEEDLSLNVKDEPFSHVNVETYAPVSDYSLDFNSSTDTMPLAA